MINRVLDLQNLSASAVVKPLSLAVTVTAETPLVDAVQKAREAGLSRLPVWGTEPKRRRIAGLLDLSDLLYRDQLRPGLRAGDFLRPALYLDEGTRLEVALRQMQRTGHRMAIVLGRDGNEIGLMTLQDILRMIFGDGQGSA